MLSTQDLKSKVADARRFANLGIASLKRHWWKSALFMALVMGVTVVGVGLTKKHYLSDARIRVGFGRNLVLDPTAQTGEKISYFENRENEINSLLEVLESRSILDQVVERIGATNILEGKLPTGVTPESLTAELDASGPSADVEVTASSTTAGTREKSHQLAVARLERETHVSVPKKSNIIVIGAKSATPEMAQAIVATLVSVYQREHLRVQNTPGSYKFFFEKANEARSNWQSAAAKLKAVKDRAGVITMEGKRNLLMEQVRDIETKLLAGESEMAGTNARIKSLQQQIAVLPLRLEVSTLSSPNQAADGMRAEYYKLQSQEQERLSRMSEDHPQITALRAQMVDLEKILAAQSPTREQPTVAINPSRQALELELLKEESSLEAIEARKKSLLAQKKDLAKELTDLNELEIEVAGLQQEVDLAESRFRNLQDKREQAHTNLQLDEDRISNLTIVQPASFISKGHGTSRALLLILGAFVGTFGGLLLAFAWDIVAHLLQSQLTSAADIEESLGLPVLGTVAVRTSVARKALNLDTAGLVAARG
ncbi:MAG: GumC family protein [Planctomycetaceae bacterium]